MDRIEEMTVFVAVAELGGFAAASRKLNLSAPTITRAVAALEAQVGAELFVRTTRFVRLTEAASAICWTAGASCVNSKKPRRRRPARIWRRRGTLVIAAPIVFGQRLLLPLLVEFLQQHPAVQRARLAGRPAGAAERGRHRLRLPHGRVAGLGAGRHATRAYPPHRLRQPGLSAAHGQPQQPEEVVDHALVVSAADGRSDRWRFVDGDREIDVEIEPRLVCPPTKRRSMPRWAAGA